MLIICHLKCTEFLGAHSQAEAMGEVNANLSEVISMLLEDSEPHLEAEFVGTQSVATSIV